MREEFVDPLPVIKTEATLIFGKVRVQCYIVDVTVDEFRVAVPGAARYEGDPRLVLATYDAIYPVHLVRQEPHAGGYSYRLRRLTTEVPGKSTSFFSKLFSIRSYLKSVAAGLALAFIAAFWLISSDADASQKMSWRSICARISGWCSSSIEAFEDVPQENSIDESLADKKQTRFDKRNSRHVHAAKSAAGELKAVSVSMISPASMTAPSLLTEDARSNSTRRSDKKNTVKLTSLLEVGQTGRLRKLTPELIPWLFGTGHTNQLGYFRVSDAASMDLQQFELGLRGLPAETRKEAVDSLRQSLRRANNINNARTVCGFDDLFVVSSDDADVYFRTRQGMVEIVRVLPIDYDKAE